MVIISSTIAKMKKRRVLRVLQCQKITTYVLVNSFNFILQECDNTLQLLIIFKTDIIYLLYKPAEVHKKKRHLQAFNTQISHLCRIPQFPALPWDEWTVKNQRISSAAVLFFFTKTNVAVNCTGAARVNEGGECRWLKFEPCTRSCPRCWNKTRRAAGSWKSAPDSGSKVTFPKHVKSQTQLTPN